MTTVINTYIETPEPTREVVSLNLDDGDTYKSRKFKTIEAASISLNDDSDAAHNVTFTGDTATVNIAGASGANCTLTLYGNQR